MRWLVLVSFAGLAMLGCDDGDDGEATDAAPPITDVAVGDDLGPVADMAPPMVDAAPPDMAGPHPGLRDPSLAMETAPETYAVQFETTAGDFVMDVTRAWAPLGADRIYNLVRIGYFDDVAFFRVLEGFVAQTGINGNPVVAAIWLRQDIPDDPVTQSNTRGTVTFATSGPDTRSAQIFFNFGNNANLDGQGFAPFGMVRDMTALDALYAEYGDGPPRGMGPDQARIRREGNAYLRAEYPELDYIIRARLME